jgi:hypothetical protein
METALPTGKFQLNRSSSHGSNAEPPPVYNLDSLGGVCRDSARGQSVSAFLVVSSSTFRKVFRILNLNGAYFAARAWEDGADSPLLQMFGM